MYNKFMIYLHLNGLHGEAKYYKYLMSQMDFENQVADEIKRFCETRLKPAIDLNTLNEECLGTLVDSLVCKNGILNPYTKEAQFALQYIFDDDEISKRDQDEFKLFLLHNYNNCENMEKYILTNNFSIADYEFEDMVEIIRIDCKDLLSI
ncbi:Mv-ORF47 peptide [Maruca vitrata nucleopolyhedrovirus]|uniref:Mv-ORF47 peptide n=1 Tax=Maruca vitrata nucleopolyhedrovirus TaxID=1307954 RepID=A1YRA9_9ABAC|nr:Mv-ORF47 peptide [Maruca vitrata nucleopolyhedrovirus]ABL75999.1 Mv-ORF47 peptide [Maruca vitrata nucleopolyhedrovirus]